jgi:phosphoribosylaminoimidazolecarboxamide formyltransferase/IMP cyclohydrolase
VRKAERAILSVSDKTGIVEFAKGLALLGIELISTGGTFRTLADAGLPVRYVSEVTGFPEILEGRVKTLHPMIHGGILARRDKPSHLEQAAKAGIGLIDLVVVNLYPFEATVSKPGVTREDAIENIDIGGPTMVRAAAKNFDGVGVIVNPARYTQVLTELTNDGGVLSDSTRLALAAEAFAHTAGYDTLIQAYLHEERHRAGEAPRLPDELFLHYHKAQDLRYGENPHQAAAFYAEKRAAASSLVNARQLSGKELSFNNINDADAALALVGEFSEPAVVAVKHTTPCGAAVGGGALEAFTRAYACDPVSIFGGIVAFNVQVDAAAARSLAEIFLEVIQLLPLPRRHGRFLASKRTSDFSKFPLQ